MNKEPIKANIYHSIESYNDGGPGSIFLWRFAAKVKDGSGHGYIKLKCPGCGEDGVIDVRTEDKTHPGDRPCWIISGLPDKITLSPSLNCVGCCGWHGWLKNGVFKL